MDDFGRIAWHWSSALAVLLFDHPEDFHQFCQSLLCCWHQGMAPGYRRNLSHPSIGLVSIEHDLVIIEAHVPSFYPGRAIVSAITRSIARLSGGFWRQFAQQLIEGNETRVEHALARADLHLRSRVVRSVPSSNSGRDSWKVAETSICVAEKIGIRQPDPLNVGAPRSVTALSVDAVSGSPSGMAALVISAAALGHGLVLVRGFDSPCRLGCFSASRRSACTPSAGSPFFFDTAQNIRGAVELLARMRRGDDGADAGLAVGDGGESDAGGEESLVKKATREFVRAAGFPDHDRGDGSLTHARIETARGEGFL